MNKMSKFLIFVLGAAVGSIITWQYTKKFYEKRTQEEIESVKETYSRKNQKHDTLTHDTPEKEEKKKIIENTKKIIKESKYTANNEDSAEEYKPYVISPDEFGEIDDYEQVSLTYYADQILADENDDMIEDIEDIVGWDSLTHFGEYEDDSVFVRNDRLKCDYEILLDDCPYSDIIKRMPHKRED